MIKSAFDNIEILSQTGFAHFYFLAEQLTFPRIVDTDLTGSHLEVHFGYLIHRMISHKTLHDISIFICNFK